MKICIGNLAFVGIEGGTKSINLYALNKHSRVMVLEQGCPDYGKLNEGKIIFKEAYGDKPKLFIQMH